MSGHLKKIAPYLAFILFTLIFSAGLLLFHHITPGNPEKNSFNVLIYGPLIIVFNYDSPEFLKDANSPIELLEKTNIRQSRPGLILLAASLNKLVSPLHFQDILFDLFKGRSFEYFTKEYLFPYLIYTSLNYLILFVSFILFFKSLDIKTGAATGGAIVLSSLLVWNDVTKAFLLTPHTQLFNILAPLFCLYVFQRVKNHQLFDKALIFLLAFLAGLGVTAYATFILFIPSVIISLGWNVLAEKRKVDLRMVLRLSLVIILTVLPLLAWVLYVYSQTGGFYQFEIVQYQQFVWILPLLRTAPWSAVARILVNFGVMVWLALRQAIFLPLILVLVCVISADRNHTILHQFDHIKKFPLAALVVSGLFLLFFAMDGMLINRVAFTAVPPLVVGIAIVVNDILGDTNRLHRGLGTIAVILLVCLQCVITLAKVGPFS